MKILGPFVAVLWLGCLATTVSAQVVDGDGDRVSDDVDQCLYTPIGVAVDARGCSSVEGDDDRDGVPDQIDRCPFSPPKVRIDSQGCAMDEDSDGVADGLDRCPATVLGQTVDVAGCPLTRAQPSGPVLPVSPPAPIVPIQAPAPIAEPAALLPPANAPRRPPEVRIPVLRDPSATASPPTALPQGRSAPMLVSAAELPAGMGQAAVADEGVLLRTVGFRRNGQLLDRDSQTALTRVAETLLAKLPQRPRLRLHVIGHADPETEAARADNLAAARANQVKGFLIRLGVPRERVTSEARGANDARYQGAEQARNRRAEIRILGLDETAPVQASVPKASPTMPIAPSPPVSMPVPTQNRDVASARPPPVVPAAMPESRPPSSLTAGNGSILFDGGDTLLDAKSIRLLETLLPQLRYAVAASSTARIEIMGHADRRTEHAMAASLSADRAQQVRDWLEGQGIDPQRLRLIGRSDLESNGSQAAPNRRVDIRIVAR